MQTGKLFQFHNCKILRKSEIYYDDLWVRNAKIVDPEKIFYDEKIIADEKIDCNGCLISPGFIDLQINGGFGFDFSTLSDVKTEESVNVVAKGILQHGVTSFCPTVITSSPQKYKEISQKMSVLSAFTKGQSNLLKFDRMTMFSFFSKEFRLHWSRNQSKKIIPNIKKRSGGDHGAGVLGIHVEGPFINKEKKGAHPVQYIKDCNKGFEDLLSVYGKLDNICLLTLAPELDVNGNIIKELVRRGITVSLGHSNGSLLEGERGFAYGASFITHLFNAMLPFHHRDPGLVGLLTSKKLPQNKSVFYGIIADGIHTHPAALRIAYHSNPKGLVLVTDAMSAMGLKEGTYCIGESVVEVTNDRAVIAGTDTLSGSIATMDYCIRFLLKSTGCSLAEALECATLHPAQVLNITKLKGTLDFGTDADFVLLDENVQVQSTYISGKCVWTKTE